MSFVEVGCAPFLRQSSHFPPVQAIGGAPDALRMQRVVSFYEKLPRGPAPEAKAKGILGRYQAKYFGKKTSVQRGCYYWAGLFF